MEENMKARFNILISIIASALVSGCVAYPYNSGYAGSSTGGQYSPTGADGLMEWAKGVGGHVVHGRAAQCRPDWYGQMYCQPVEWASSVNVQHGVPSAQSGGPVMYIEKPTNPNVTPKP
jgi:hypothetical protein